MNFDLIKCKIIRLGTILSSQSKALAADLKIEEEMLAFLDKSLKSLTVVSFNFKERRRTAFELIGRRRLDSCKRSTNRASGSVERDNIQRVDSESVNNKFSRQMLESDSSSDNQYPIRVQFNEKVLSNLKSNLDDSTSLLKVICDNPRQSQPQIPPKLNSKKGHHKNLSYDFGSLRKERRRLHQTQGKLECLPSQAIRQSIRPGERSIRSSINYERQNNSLERVFEGSPFGQESRHSIRNNRLNCADVSDFSKSSEVLINYKNNTAANFLDRLNSKRKGEMGGANLQNVTIYEEDEVAEPPSSRKISPHNISKLLKDSDPTIAHARANKTGSFVTSSTTHHKNLPAISRIKNVIQNQIRISFNGTSLGESRISGEGMFFPDSN